MTVYVFSKKLKKEFKAEGVKQFGLKYPEKKDYFEFEFHNGLFTTFSRSNITRVER